MCKKTKFYLFIKIVILSLVGLAFMPLSASAETLGTLSESLLGPTTIVTEILIYACYIVGAVFFFMAIAQYKIHRESPKLVPLSTPVMLALFGAILALLPYFSTLFNSGSAVEYSKQQGVINEEEKGLRLPPLDLPRRKGPGDFYQKSQEEAPSTSNRRAPSKSTRDSSPPPREDRHWGEDL